MVDQTQELEILQKAAVAFEELDRVTARKRQLDEDIRSLCRQFDIAGRVWGFQPHNLRRACEARGIMEVAA
jgi:hypothetical protein